MTASTSNWKLRVGYLFFLFYTASYFSGLTERFKFLGTIRFDFILIIALLILAIFVWLESSQKFKNEEIVTTKLLLAILIYVLITIPFVRWPGSVLYRGIPEFVKSIIFYFCAMSFVKGKAELKTFLTVYFLLLLFIIMEPFYYWITEGRMGYVDFSMGNDGHFDRLAGTSTRVGGSPNGLAAVVAITIPLVILFFRLTQSGMIRLLLAGTVPCLAAVLVQTGSRSGMLAALVSTILCTLKSKFKIAGLISFLLVGIVVWHQLDQTQKQRYLSVIDDKSAGRKSAEGRIVGIEKALNLFTQRPLFGFGLGTFREASWNIQKGLHVSHNTYTGTLVELGIAGFILYMLYIISILKNIRLIKRITKGKGGEDDSYFMIAESLEIIIITWMVFSLFAGGPSYYIWFLIGAMSVILLRLAGKHSHESEGGMPHNIVYPRYQRNV